MTVSALVTQCVYYLPVRTILFLTFYRPQRVCIY